MRQLKSLDIILFILEVGTLLYFIPLLMYLAEYSFKIGGIGFLAGVMVVIHYYIYRWYLDRGSLIYFGVSILVGAVGVTLTMFFDLFHSIFFPAGFLLEYSSLFLPEVAIKTETNSLYYYYVFLTGLFYTNVTRSIILTGCKIFRIDKCPFRKPPMDIEKDITR